MVKQEKVHIDGHTGGENTPLTDAAHRGDVNGIEFIVVELGANIHASCGCHIIKLHYTMLLKKAIMLL